MDKLFGIYLPYLIFAGIAANAVLSRFGFNYVYALLMAIGVVAMMATGISLSGVRDKILLLAYFISILVMVVVHAIMLHGEMMIVSAALIYIFVPAYWFVYFCKYDDNYLTDVIGLSIPIVYVIGFLGVVQFFYSPTLFGLIEMKSNSLEWANNTTFDVYSAFFRASSTLGSPQVYGLFMALCIVLIHSRTGKTSILACLGLAFLFFSGLLSGNKSFVAVLFVHFSWRIVARRGHMLRNAIISLLAFIALAYGVGRAVEYVPILERFASIEQVVEQEEGDSRLGKYRFIISNTNPLVGNGLGTLTNRSAPGIRAAESYILKMYYEVGAFVVAIFIVILLAAYLNASRSEISGAKELIVLMFFSMIIVHAFDSPAFFLFWGIVVSTFGANRKSVSNLYPLRVETN